MRVAIVSSTFSSAKPGGVPTYVDGRARWLSKKCSVRVFALGGGTGTGGCVSLGDVKGFRSTFFKVWWRLLLALREFRPDVVEVHNIPIGLPLFFLARPSYFFHGPAGMEARAEGGGVLDSWLRWVLEGLVIRKARKVYVVSDAFGSLVKKLHKHVDNNLGKLRKRYPRLICSHVPVSELNCGYVNTDSDALMLVCVRRLVRRTGVLELVQAFSNAICDGKIHHESSLYVIGEGPMMSEIRECIEACGCANNVRLLGRIGDSERNRLFQCCDYNVVPTQELEGFGLVVVEAAFFGCPSIVTCVGALPEVVGKLDHVGVICGPTVSEISEALGCLIKVSQQRRAYLQRVAVKRFGIRSSGGHAV